MSMTRLLNCRVVRLKKLGHFETTEYDLGSGPQCEKGFIVVPENRAIESSRNIGLQFYRLKARNPSDKSPIFKLPGGPGGYFDDNWVNGLKNKPEFGSNAMAWMYTHDRDVVLVNQRGARLPDRRYMAFRFMFGGMPANKPFSPEKVSSSMKSMSKRSIEHWTKQGMDLAGYDISNMVEDINEIRNKLGYEKISLRGSSFGSQWSFAYMQKYPQHVDRAVLSGIEPLDHGYDSPQGIWNVFERLNERLQASNPGNKLQLPDVSLTDALKKIVERLEKEPVEATGKHPQRGTSRAVPLGVDDFRRYLRRGNNARRESTQALQKLPKFIYEIYNEDYSYLASKTIEERVGMGGGSLQLILVDNSLGISKARDEKLVNEAAYRWIGELNDIYKATRDVTPTPVINDSQRVLTSDIPILFVHGDLDLSTPIENAEEAMPTLSNVHLIRIQNGTHGAFDQIQRHDPEFVGLVKKFLDADFSDGSSIKSLGLPDSMDLPDLEFDPMGSPTMFEQLIGDK